MVSDEEKNYEAAAVIAAQVAAKIANNQLPARSLLNVNVPSSSLAEIKGLQVTRLGTRHAAEPIIKMKDPRGKTIYWVGMAGPEEDAGLGTDFHAINHGYVSVTPLHLDMTHYKLFDQLSECLGEISV